MARSTFRIFSLHVLALIGLCPLAFADIFVKGNPSNKEVSIPLDASMAGKKIIVTVIGKSADHQNLRASLVGPAGVKLSVKSMTVTNAAAASTNYKKFGIATKLYGQYSTSYSTAAETQRAIASSGEGDPSCGCLTYNEIEMLLAAFGGGVSRTLLCSGYPPRDSCPTNPNNGGSGGGTEPPPSSQESGYASAFIESNRCLRGGKPAAAIELDLSGVAQADLTGAIKIKTSMSIFGGNRRAAIKPRSDGGVFPGQALLLAGPVGGADAGVKLARFSSAKRIASQALPVPSTGGYIYYRGNSYLRRPITKYLRGGRGVFQISGGGQGYSVCVSLTRTRQNLNGYKN